jgi:hypothetical protein
VDLQGLQLLSNLGFVHAFASFFQQVHISILWERKGVKTHTLALIDGPQDADSNPEAIDSLEN